MSAGVLVVGAGIVGLSTAYYAARKGHAVTVLDRGDSRDEGCSTGNAGMIVPSHFVPLAAPGAVATALRWMTDPESPFYVRPRPGRDLLRWGWRFWRSATGAHVARSAPLLRDLHLASRACFEALAGDLGDFGLTTRGLLMLCKTRRGLDEEASVAEQAVGLGLPAEVLTAQQAAALEPELTLDVAGAVRYPLDAHLDPARLMTLLRARLEALGVRLAWRHEVTGWRRQGRRLAAARTTRGDVDCDELVLAAGSWSGLLARDLGLALPLQPGKGYSLTLEHPRRMPRHGAILHEARVAVTPLGSRLRFGGTLELAGLDLSVDPRRVRGIVRSIPRYFPDFAPEEFDGVAPWCGLRPCSPDGLPYLGRSRRFDNVTLATGHALLGVSLGPISGKMVAEVLSGETPSLDLAALDPDRHS